MAPAAALVCKAGAGGAVEAELSYTARAMLDDEAGTCMFNVFATKAPEALALLFLAERCRSAGDGALFYCGGAG